MQDSRNIDKTYTSSVANMSEFAQCDVFISWFSVDGFKPTCENVSAAGEGVGTFAFQLFDSVARSRTKNRPRPFTVQPQHRDWTLIIGLSELAEPTIEFAL
eukprot:1022277-Amphidinium_carterae.1